MRGRRLLLVFLFAAWAAGSFAATRPQFQPEIGRRLDLDLAFTDANAHNAALSVFTGGKPTLLLLGYHRCPNLCGIAQLDLAQSLAMTGLAPGDYSVVFTSIDSSETSEDAEAARKKLAQALEGGDLESWHFLIGKPTQVAALENSVGMTVGQRPASELYVHPVALSTLTPDGRIARVLPGIGYAPRDLRLAIVEASKGKLGTLGEHILLLCSGFDPTTGRYTSAVMLGLQLAGSATIALLGSAILVMLWRRA